MQTAQPFDGLRLRTNRTRKTADVNQNKRALKYQKKRDIRNVLSTHGEI